MTSADGKDNRFELHETYLNGQLVKLLKTIGFDRHYVKAQGPYLWDADGGKYLDCLSGYGVFTMGRNHPKIKRALTQALEADLPSMVQMDCPLLAGRLAEKLVSFMPPELNKVFFCNSGTEAVEAVIKFARAATGRPKIIYCDHAFHGLTCGSLSLNGDEIFRDGFEPFLGGCEKIPFNDVEALEKALVGEDAACFIVEPLQGKGINLPSQNYFAEARKICDRTGTLLCMDEVQTGLGRTGKFLAGEHWGVQPDLVTLAKALSGGFIPVGAVIAKQWIFEKVFNRLDKAVVHGSTFGKNTLAMAAGLASLEVLKEENLVEQAAANGTALKEGLQRRIGKFECVREVRGLGMMLGIEFGPPKSIGLKAGWKLLEKANKGLFCQIITIPLFKKHRILCQVAGHNSYVIKLLPALNLSPSDIGWILDAFADSVAAAHRFPGAIWDLGTSLAGNALANRKGVEAWL